MRKFLKDNSVAIMAFLFSIYVYLVPPEPPAPVPLPAAALMFAFNGPTTCHGQRWQVSNWIVSNTGAFATSDFGTANPLAA